MIIFFWCASVRVSSHTNIFTITIVMMKKADNSPIAVYQKRLSSEVTFVTLLINGISFKSPLDDEFHTFRWEEYLRSTGTIAAPSHLFKAVSITTFLIYLSATLPNVYVDNTIKKRNR